MIGVLVLSNLLLFVLLFRSFAKTDQLEHRLGDYADRIASRMFATAYDVEGSGKAVIVIPAFNEESSLPEVLAAMPKELHGLEVETIVVSDGSVDATEEVAHQYGALVVGRDLRRGQGAAVRLGYRVALARGPSVVATVDSDGQYDPLEFRSSSRRSWPARPTWCTARVRSAATRIRSRAARTASSSSPG